MRTKFFVKNSAIIIGFVLFLGLFSNVQAQFKLRSPYTLGETINCYASGKKYKRTVNSKGITGGFAMFPNFNSDVQSIFNEVAPFIKVTETIDLIATTDTENAEACRSDNGVYFILFNANWLVNLYKDKMNIWTLRATIAHEVGHIIYNHSIIADQSSPEMELEADWYAGMILAKMGAEWEQVVSAYRSNGFANLYDTDTHPGINKRLEFVKAGFNNNRLIKSPSVNSNVSVKMIAKCIFFGEPITYMVNSNDDIIGYYRNKSRFIGKRIASRYPEFVWMYAINGGLIYGVDAQGRIWNRTPLGVPFQIGVVQYLRN